MTEVLYIIMFIVFIYFLLLAVSYSLLLIASFPDTYNSFKQANKTSMETLLNDSVFVPITVIIPLYNDKDNVLDAIFSVLNSEYKSVNILVVNDGSTDEPFTVLKSLFQLYEVPTVIHQPIETAPIKKTYQSRNYLNLRIIDKEHAGSSDTINVGLNLCDTPLYMTLDSDTVIEPDAISHLLFGILSKDHCIVVGGSVYVKNGCKIEKGKMIERRLPYAFVSSHQASEYLRAFIYGRAGWNKLGGTFCHSGAFTMYETQAVKEVGGYDKDNFSYDVEIIIKLHNYMRGNKFPYKILYNASAVAWTQVPSTLKSYWKQRDHWQRGMLNSMSQYIGMLFNPRFKSLGFVNFPHYVLFEVFGPIVEFLSYITVLGLCYLGELNQYALFLFFILAWAYNEFLTVACILLNIITFNIYEKVIDTLNMLSMTVVETIGFRQYRALICFTGLIHFLINRIQGKKQ